MIQPAPSARARAANNRFRLRKRKATSTASRETLEQFIARGGVVKICTPNSARGSVLSESEEASERWLDRISAYAATDKATRAAGTGHRDHDITAILSAT